MGSLRVDSVRLLAVVRCCNFGATDSTVLMARVCLMNLGARKEFGSALRVAALPAMLSLLRYEKSVLLRAVSFKPKEVSGEKFKTVVKSVPDYN
jgi:hypothetical protein